MSYTHIGRILENGETDPVVISPGSKELRIRPEDDGLHITGFNRGDFEWWYFDLAEPALGIFLKIVLHIGTDPLRRRVFPQLAISVNTPETTASITRSYSLDELHADTGRCSIKVRDEISIMSEDGTPELFRVKADVPGFKCEFGFTGTLEGWKPLGNAVSFSVGKKKGSFSWVVPLPAAKAGGTFTCEGQEHTLDGATAYHDHNYFRVDRDHPLHLDELVTRWYWGKCYAGNHHVIFMDTWCRTKRLRSLMVARDQEIIYSGNNLLTCTVSATETDSVLHTDLPTGIHLESTDPEFRFRADLDMIKMLDRKDLIGELHPVLKFLIKKLVSRPAYHGILTGVRMQIGATILEGTGNFESMVFRSRQESWLFTHLITAPRKVL